MRSAWILLLAALMGAATASRLRDMFYTNLDSSAFSCTRLMDATRQIGCSSPEDGAIGVLFLIENDADLTLFKNAPEDAYIALISQKVFTPANVKELFKLKHFKGAYVFDDGFGTSGGNFSVDDVLPNRLHGLGFDAGTGTSVLWNAAGGGMGNDGTEGLHWQDYTHFPIYWIKDEDRDLIMQRYNQTNRVVNGKYPSYNMLGADLDNFMFGVKNAEICLRRDQCDPLGGFNLYATLAPFDPTKKTIVVAAQIDSLAFFHERSFGADADVSGVVTLLAAAHLLGDPLNNAVRDASNKNIMFMLFDGESFGYIGSSKVGRDIYNTSYFPTNKAPLNFQDIDGYIEVNQLLTGDSTLHSYAYESNALAKSVSDALKNSMDKVAADLSVPISLNFETGYQLPPASLRSLLYEMRNDTMARNFPGIVVTDHDGSGFKNSFYHSRFDTATNIGVKTSLSPNVNQTAAAATALARAVWALASGATPATLVMPRPAADVQLVDALFNCITVNSSCQLASQLIGGSQSPNQPMSLYVGVVSSSLKMTSAFMFSALARAVAIDRNVSSLYNNNNCKSSNRPPSYQLLQLNNGVCLNTTAYIHQAISPAFSGSSMLPVGTGPDYMDGRDPRWSTWTESRWDSISSRIFLMSSKNTQIYTLVGGALWFIFSFVLMYFLSKNLTQSPARMARD